MVDVKKESSDVATCVGCLMFAVATALIGAAVAALCVKLFVWIAR